MMNPLRLGRRWRTMILTRLSVSLWGLAVALPAAAQFPAVSVVRVQAHPAVPDLQCAALPKAATSAASVDTDPREVPDDADVQAALSALGAAASPEAQQIQKNQGVLGQALLGEPYRVAIWGDSHLAAGFFTQELVKILKLSADQVRTSLIPATMGRSGVRLPLRKSCVSPHWRYESAHASAAGAAAPGPGLVNLFATQPGATLAWDVRNAAGVAEARQIRVLYQQTQTPLQLAVSVDGDPEVEVVLSGSPGPAILELAGDGPLSVVRIRLMAGDMRLHGLALPVPASTALQLDVFGYPGATVAGWKQASLDYGSAWFGQTRYNLVMMEYGTNEGNAKPFDAQAYQQTLRQSVRQMRSVFPDAACVLIAPGDRGVLIRRSEQLRLQPSGVRQVVGKAKGKVAFKSPARSGKKSAPAKGGARQSKVKTAQRPVTSQRGVDAPAVVATPAQSEGAGAAKNLLQYTLIHEQIGRIQTVVAQENGCRVWSMLQAMGGQGGAYRWVRQSPPLMARDLIHFTVPGYQQLANQFASDMGWDAAQVLPGFRP